MANFSASAREKVDRFQYSQEIPRAYDLPLKIWWTWVIPLVSTHRQQYITMEWNCRNNRLFRPFSPVLYKRLFQTIYGRAIAKTRSCAMSGPGSKTLEHYSSRGSKGEVTHLPYHTLRSQWILGLVRTSRTTLQLQSPSLTVHKCGWFIREGCGTGGINRPDKYNCDKEARPSGICCRTNSLCHLNPVHHLVTLW